MFNKETGMYEGYIYEIYNSFNMKSYIGQTTRTVEYRWRRHVNTSKRTLEIYFHEDLRLYGEDSFNVYTIEKVECDSMNELHKKLDELEKYYINYKNTLVPNGYNVSIGGSNPPINSKGAVYQFDFKGNMLNSYNNTVAAEESTGVLSHNIIECCNGRMYRAGGYYWSRNNVLSDEVIDFILKTIVVQYSLSGKKIAEYDSIKDASDKTGIQTWNISACCRGAQLSAGGYVWRHGDKEFDSFRTKSKINSHTRKDYVS